MSLLPQVLSFTQIILSKKFDVSLKFVLINFLKQYNFCRGMVCQLVRKKNRGGQDILAVGGRYDHLIAEFAEKFSLV